MSMQRISSQLTIVLRVAIPTMWITSILTIAVFTGWYLEGRASLFSNPILWGTLLFCLVIGILFTLFFFWRFYRIDIDETHLYVSNYIKTYRYPLDQIDRITRSTILPNHVHTIHLLSKGTFGQHITFLMAKALWKDYLDSHPENRDHWFRDQNSTH